MLFDFYRYHTSIIMRKIILTTLLFTCLFLLTGCQIKNGQDISQQKEGSITVDEHRADVDNLDGEPTADVDNSDEELEVKVPTEEEWTAAYKEVLSNIDEYLVDPYEYFPINNWVYIGLHDYDSDSVPELLIGGSASAAIFTYEEGTAVKLIDLYLTESWGGINGIYFNNNCLVLINNGSDGSGYTCFTNYNGTYVSGFYDDYSPEDSLLNNEPATREEVEQYLGFKELTNSLSRYEQTVESGIIYFDDVSLENLDLNEFFY